MRRRQSRVERQRRIKRILIGGVIVVTVVVVGLLVYGLIIDPLVKMQRPVAIVHDVPITMGELREEVCLVQSAQGQPLPQSDIDTLLDSLIRGELVRQEAARRKIAVAPEEVQRRIEQNFGFYRETPTPRPTPTATPVVSPTEELTPTPTVTPFPTPVPKTEEEFRQEYDQQLEEWGVSDQYFRDFVEAGLLEEALQDSFIEEVPLTDDQVQLRYLQVYSQTQASELLGRLESGEDFETLMEEVEAEAPGSSIGLAWYPQTVLEQRLGAELTEQAFGLETGVFTHTVGGWGYYVVEVVAHEERELDEEMRQELAGEAFSRWLEFQMTLVQRLDYDIDFLSSCP